MFKEVFLLNKYNKIYNFTVGILLLLYMSIIFFLNMMNPDKIFSESENRKLEQAPKLSIDALIDKKFTTNFEKYTSDQFVIRDFWIGVKSDIERIIGKKENNGVYLAKDGFLIQTFNKPNNENVKEKIETVNSLARIPNVNKYFMLVPNAIEILHDKLPSYGYSDDQTTYINAVKTSLDSNIEFIDVSGSLYSKKDEYIFYKTDHHWTTKGAYYAYVELSKNMGLTPHDKDYFNVQTITDNFYGSLYSKSGFRHIKPDSIELYVPKAAKEYQVEYYDNNISSNSLYDMDSLNKKDKYTAFFGGNHPLIKITTNTNNENKLVVIKDSYANCFIPFLTEYYSEIYVVDPRYYNDDFNTLIESNKINNMLILYNLNTFFEDNSINNILQE